MSNPRSCTGTRYFPAEDGTGLITLSIHISLWLCIIINICLDGEVFRSPIGLSAFVGMFAQEGKPAEKSCILSARHLHSTAHR
mmetsp:Transcript_28276/g.50879  ORF Transcript_28276/g.50879 Transcript_28276/m.50879 type:complete len:83 (-) Transcript_28276:1218-1466(-)